MSFTPQSNDYQDEDFGFREEIIPQDNIVEDTKDYTDEDFGFREDPSNVSKPKEEKPKKEKVGLGKSILYGAAETALAPALIKEGLDSFTSTLAKKVLGDNNPLEALTTELMKGNIPNPLTLIKTVTGFDPFEKLTEYATGSKTPASDIVSSFPESKDELSRRLRVGTQAVLGSAALGIPGILMGLVGSQAGQTVREVYGKDGKFDTLGWGEGAAILTDAVAGSGVGALSNVIKKSPQALRQLAGEAPSLFRPADTRLQKAVVTHALKGEKSALDQIISNFSKKQVSSFEESASRISPNKYTDLTQSNASAIKRQSENMFRNGQLSVISPLNATPEQGGRALQDSANAIFTDQVTTAERNAYGAANKASEELTGTAPQTIEAAKKLRDDLIRNTPTNEQNPIVNFLNNLIEDLETTTPASQTPASKLVDASGKPLIAATETAASQTATTKSANEMVDLVQKGNYAVNYGSEYREQSHRLIPVIDTLRIETGNVLSQNETAFNLYQTANNLHAQNAETWGTKFVRNLRFSENPEKIIGNLRSPSNMRNFKQIITDPRMQAVAERLVVDDITSKGGEASNRIAINNLSPELSTNARNVSENLIQRKDPLTTSGGRATIVNEILKDSAQSVNTGRRPEKILNLMQTPKGYQIVRESLNATPESRTLFKSFERLFVEDIFTSIIDKNGAIDFSKARNILKNNEIKEVVRLIGGDELITRFSQLETFANNFERNLSFYKSPQAQTIFHKVGKEVATAGILGGVLRALHMPLSLVTSLGLYKATAGTAKVTFNTIRDKILSNPKAVKILEIISNTDKAEVLSQQLPRLIAEIEKSEKE